MAAKRKLSSTHVEDDESKCSKTSGDEIEQDDRIHAYRLLLEEVGKRLYMEDLQRIAKLEDLCERDIDNIFHQNHDYAGALFQCLEELGRLHMNDVSVLRDGLNDIGRIDVAKLVEDYEPNYSADFPPEPDSDEAEDDISNARSFEEILKAIGLEGTFPGKRRLEEFLGVVCDVDSSNIVYLFWQKITCLDYRAGLPQIMSCCTIQCSMRDFIFSVLHCADDFLRQDILEKLSACQLAVPILLSGIRYEKPIFLRWACRKIMKKWKGRYDSFTVEQPIVSHPIFTVSVIRIGEVGVSKSQLLNYMLGPCQGFGSHPYFLTKERDKLKARFSLGTVESVWFLPSSGSKIFRDAIAFFNLRGDCTNYHTQRQFACKVANLTVALVTTNKRKDFRGHIKEIKKNSSHTLFISVSEREGASGDVKIKDNWIFVKRNQIETLSAKLCQQITCTIDQNKTSVSALCKFVARNVDIDETNPDIKKAKSAVDNMFQKDSDQDVLTYKYENFPLQKYWKELVQLDKERLTYDTEDGITFEQRLAQRKCTESMNRARQMKCQLSNSVKLYLSSVKNTTGNDMLVKYFLSILHDKIFQVVSTNTIVDMEKISNLEERKKNFFKDTNIVMNSEVEDDNNVENLSIRQRERQHRDQQSYNMLCTELKKLHEYCRVKTLGCEHFLREIGQQYEAYMAACRTELARIDCTDFPQYPLIAAELILRMHPFELMDGDTEYVPITWVTAVLDALRLKLNNPKVLVLSVIGVQSSGKSTLFNSMFGLRFPVRAGRCTRGLFIRLLKVEEKCEQALGFKYLIVVDTEGLRSIDHDDHTFDNELVTFALGIADVTMFNISGENIGSDVAGILQIAAHALMRMKEVDLECRCMIVQQRVSDLTAADRNKANTQKLKDTLDEATKFAAEEEGLEGRYKEFSDVVDLRFDQDLQYIPSLWTGGMAPPNHMYGEKVTNIREGLLRDIRNKVIIPELTLSTFTDRVRDVWSAVKEENFVFNFRDSVRAVDFNQFCLYYNGWIVKMRQAMMNQSAHCLFSIRSLVTNADGIESLKTSLYDEAEREYKTLTKLVDDYVLNHPRKTTISKHKQGFIEDIGIALKDARNQAIQMINEEYDIRKLEHNLPNLGGKWLVKMIKDVKEVARKTPPTTSPVAYRHSLLYSVPHPYRHTLYALWTKWTKDIKQESGITQIKISPSDIKTLCDKLLLRMTRDMAIGSEIRNLLSNEGGIEKHIEISDGTKYINDKHVKAWIKNRHKPTKDDGIPCETDTKIPEHILIQTEKEKAAAFMKHSVEQKIDELKRQEIKYFDTNVFQLLVRKTLTDLSIKTEESIKLPISLIAKGLMHFSGRAFHEVYKPIVSSDDTFSSFFEIENDLVSEQFDMFVAQRDMEYCASKFVYYYIEKELNNKLNDFRENIDYSDYTERLQLPWDVLLCYDICGWKFFVNELFDLASWCSDYFGCDSLLSDKLDDNDCKEMVRLRNIYLEFIIKLESSLDKTTSCEDWINLLLSVSDIDEAIRHTDELYDSPRPMEVSRHLKKYIEVWNADRDDEYFSYFDTPSLRIAAGLSNICDVSCPMCGMFCDNIMKSNQVHSSHLHRPRGMTHETYPGTDQMVLEDCSASILLPGAMCTLHYKKFHCKDYKEHYPDWDIRPSTNDPGKLFWQWNLVDYCKHFNYSMTTVPESWLNITKEEALQSLKDDKILKIKGRSKQNQSGNKSTTIDSETSAADSLVREEI